MAQLTFCNHTIFENGASRQLGDVLKNLSVARPLICTDRGLIATGLVSDVLEGVQSNLSAAIFQDTPANPTQEAVALATAHFRESGCDGVVAIGGGSSIDLAKAVALAATHGGDLCQYTAGLGGVGRIGEIAPLVAIPTTAGTGSEVSNGAVIIMDNGEKLILASKHLIPKVALCDPLLTLGLPPFLTAATGMDAVTHCIEALLSPAINPPAEAVACDGLKRSVRDGFLLRAFQDGADKEARWQMMMTATEGAMAFSKGLGAVHAMSHACGADPQLRLHHGTLNAVLLPTVLRFNEPVCSEKYRRLRRSLGLENGVQLDQFIKHLNSSLGLPENLRAMGIDEGAIGRLAEHAAKDVCNFTNPRPCSLTDYQSLFREALDS